MLNESLAGLGLTITFLTYYGLNLYVYRGYPRWVLRRGLSSLHGVYLSFDDGPSPKYTQRVLDILEENKVEAAFFLIGKQASKCPSLVREIRSRGHLVGNHTQNHLLLPLLSSRRIYKEIVDGKMTLEDILGESVDMLRPPRGLFDRRVLKISRKLDLKLVLWSLSSFDWRGMKANAILRHVRKKIRPGDVLLFHDGGYVFGRFGSNRENSVNSLPLILDLLPTRGLKPLPFSLLLEREEKGRRWQKSLFSLP